MKTLAQARPGECRFCERTDEQVVDRGGAMLTPTRCNRRDCMMAFEQETRRELEAQRVRLREQERARKARRGFRRRVLG